MDDRTRTLFFAWGTPIKVRPAVLADVAVLLAGLSWLIGRRHPGWSRSRRLLAAVASALTLLSADLGHAVAHILSARRVGAPMDYVLVSASMPRTVYLNNDVPPRVHRGRALGGPVLNALGLAVSLLLRPLSPRGSVPREVLDWARLGHAALLLGSLAPLPMVDGGSILKWTLVEHGQSPEQADAVVRRAGLGLLAGGLAGLVAGVVALLLRRRRPWAD